MLEVSLSATKNAASKKMCDLLSQLLSSTDSLPLRGEYKLWLYWNYIVSLLHFHLSVDSVTAGAITQNVKYCHLSSEEMVELPTKCHSCCVILSRDALSQVSKQVKFTLLSCISVSSYQKIQELGLQLHLGEKYLQTRDIDYSILFKARSQLASIPMAHRLYLESKNLAAADERSCYDGHLSTLSVQCKLKDLVSLESCCGTWNRLLVGCNPGQFSFILRATSDTLPTPVNLQRWNIQRSAKCVLCGGYSAYYHTCFGWLYPFTLAQGRYTYRHDQVLNCLTTALSKFCLNNALFMLTYPEGVQVIPPRQQYLPLFL